MIRDVEEAVFGKRGRFQVLVRRRAADRDRIGELQVLDIARVDALKRRIALRVIGAVVHEPVLRLAVGIGEALGRDIGGQGGRDGEHGGAREAQNEQGTLVMRMHGLSSS